MTTFYEVIVIYMRYLFIKPKSKLFQKYLFIYVKLIGK